MSFQGDVAGIGLGELLQGLSRGGRDGVLTLYGDKLSSAIGLRKGQLYLIASPDEDEDLWRIRSQAAFIDNPAAEQEPNRRQQIARAARLETIYQMLEADNLHFRFEPGKLPTTQSGPAASSIGSISLDGGDVGGEEVDEAALGPGLTVEYVLLEQARIADESSDGPAARLTGYDIPRSVDPSSYPTEIRDFLEQCDGRSTLLEISDRQGWPLMQTRATVAVHMSLGHVRMAQPRELLAGALRELEIGNLNRASTRLSGYVVTSIPGPPPPGDADLLMGEWESGRLERILPTIEPRHARAILRKLDSVEPELRLSRPRWTAYVASQRGDELARMHAVALAIAGTDQAEARSFQDLLRLAHTMGQEGHPGRSRTLLRLAANNAPQRIQTRIELGKRMLETELYDEGAAWLLGTARELIERGDGEQARIPLRALMRADVAASEAKALLEDAETLRQRRKMRRIGSIALLSTGLIISLAALVRFREYREVERWVSEINSHMGDPNAALDLLNLHFDEEAPPRITELRQELLIMKRDRDRRLQDAWNLEFGEIEAAAQTGDPVFALRRALELGAPPKYPADTSSYPERQDLLGMLASRLGQRSEELDVPVDASTDELNQEERLVDLLKHLEGMIDGATAPPEAISFQFRISELIEVIEGRRAERARAREEMFTRERQKQQDILLGTARSHAAANDLENALSAYDRLIESDPELATLPTLQEEIGKVRNHWNAVQEALRLADEGDYEAAEQELVSACPNPIEHLLPFTVDSRPSGARVTMPDGRVRVTPFVAKSGVGENLSFRFEYEGHRKREVRLKRPRTLIVDLYRFPERTWENKNRIEAAPIPAGDDHIVCDRAGRIRRMDASGQAIWQLQFDSLGGVARTPVFLPERPGYLLVLSEDGQAWLVAAASGKFEGPYAIGSPPVRGPFVTKNGVNAYFADGRVAKWKDELEPDFYKSDTLIDGGDEAPAETDNATLAVLHRSVGSDGVLVSPFNEWRAEAREDHVRVVSPEGKGFTAEVHGQWRFMAWEAPKAFVSSGRLWISDDAGLRSYLPDDETLVQFQDE